MNKQPTTLADGIVTPLPVSREPFSSFAIDFAGLFSSDNKKNATWKGRQQIREIDIDSGSEQSGNEECPQ